MQATIDFSSSETINLICTINGKQILPRKRKPSKSTYRVTKPSASRRRRTDSKRTHSRTHQTPQQDLPTTTTTTHKHDLLPPGTLQANHPPPATPANKILDLPSTAPEAKTSTKVQNWIDNLISSPPTLPRRRLERKVRDANPSPPATRTDASSPCTMSPLPAEIADADSAGDDDRGIGTVVFARKAGRRLSFGGWVDVGGLPRREGAGLGGGEGEPTGVVTEWDYESVGGTTVTDGLSGRGGLTSERAV
ncbi:hypothetical protein EJ03DRAFT_354208 [Teratosphaeria nubilosa]|uniref:Uncharacterized protein n=1 Tax=Teratosphaeria nubilosa TaxID=161662 RepID=A0A6G1L191_9PEZI|nr:hypothetical protein EJ03DRAFT_354208 [Teratosphaeria nubilosa]